MNKILSAKFVLLFLLATPQNNKCDIKNIALSGIAGLATSAIATLMHEVLSEDKPYTQPAYFATIFAGIGITKKLNPKYSLCSFAAAFIITHYAACHIKKKKIQENTGMLADWKPN